MSRLRRAGDPRERDRDGDAAADLRRAANRAVVRGDRLDLERRVVGDGVRRVAPKREVERGRDAHREQHEQKRVRDEQSERPGAVLGGEGDQRSRGDAAASAASSAASKRWRSSRTASPGARMRENDGSASNHASDQGGVPRERSLDERRGLLRDREPGPGPGGEHADAVRGEPQALRVVGFRRREASRAGDALGDGGGPGGRRRAGVREQVARALALPGPLVGAVRAALDSSARARGW